MSGSRPAWLTIDLLVQAAHQGVWAIDAAGQTCYVDDSMADMLGHRPEQMLGRPLFDFMEERWREIAERNMARRRQGIRERHEFCLQRADGTPLWVEMSASPAYDESGAFCGALALVADIGDRKRLERELAGAQKLEAVGRLAGGIAHDFNNILTAIMSSVYLLEDELPGGSPLREELMMIYQAGERAADLTRQLLAFARQQIVEPRPCRLDDVLLKIDRLVRRIIGEDIELVTLPSAELWTILMDPAQLEQVLVNLAVNARQAMPGGGKLTIRTSNAPAMGPSILPTGAELPRGDYVVLTVADTGRGIEPEMLSHIFEPFFTSREDEGGTGLGLASVYGIVQQASGYIDVRSRPGFGTEFRIYLPRMVSASAITEEIRVGKRESRGIETILLVEDEPLVMNVAARVLRGHGYVVLEASGAADAIAISERHEGEIDLLLTDVVMPKMTGPALAEKLALHRPDMEILFTSGYTDDQGIRHRVRGSAINFLAKPFTPDALARRVREVLDARADADSAAARDRGA